MCSQFELRAYFCIVAELYVIIIKNISLKPNLSVIMKIENTRVPNL